ncbi:hypothetical protein [Dongia deserti]|uniref:hypothetical protein n=1 Tax=Dongia deserti TaxID=2268030 RepID=UPI000E647C28|nr:hypothetical protein [Dongia deserti]
MRFQLGESLTSGSLATLQVRAQLEVACMAASELRGDILVSQRVRADLHRICIETRNLLKARPTPRFRKASTTTSVQNGPRRRRFNRDQKQALRAADMALFVRRYARKWTRSWPNDRCYDAEFQYALRRMKPEMVDILLRHDEV